MLLQKLRERAEQTGDALPPMYQNQPIRYLIPLDSEGRQAGPLVDTADPASKETKNGAPRLAPHIKRGIAIKPRLLADNGVYVLRQPDPNGRLNDQDVARRHSAFVQRVASCAQATGEPIVAAVAQFLETLDPDTMGLPPDYSASATLTFRVDGAFPIDLPSVRSYWAAATAPDESTGASSLACIVCGQVRPVLTRHPIPIKGIPGGQAQKDLISANEGAFMSFGLENSAVAPTCQECAEAYGNALNALLASPNHRVLVGELAYAFWTAVAVEFDFVRLVSKPDDETASREVAELLVAYRTGRIGALAVDETAFYAVGLGPSGKRIVVHDWMDVSVGEAKRRLARYFLLQGIVEWDGSPGNPMPYWRLVNATVRNARRESPPPIVGQSLFRLAVRGDPLPLDLLLLAVHRNRAEQTVTRERAALIKMVLYPEEGESATMAQLNREHSEQAYHLGRALALFDAIQYQALGSVNASVVDKFYGTASASPATVFPLLHRMSQHHLRKIHALKKGRHNELELEAVMDEISDPPRVLTLPQQGLFALGYYHQRAAGRRASDDFRKGRAAAEELGEED